jgi:trehalose 6-phosphate synthase
MNRAGRLIIVSNRLPITAEATNDGIRLKPSSGGLVTALIPVLQQQGGSWVGSMDACCDEIPEHLVADWPYTNGYSLEPVFMSPGKGESFYVGFSNEIIWPLFHGLPSRCQFGSDYWRSYLKANETFSARVERIWNRQDFIWVHDYHLMLVGSVLRARGWRGRLGYFHHIPFPPADIFETLPWRFEVLDALMQFNTLGFQTARDRQNFVASLHIHLPGSHSSLIGDRIVVRSGDRTAAAGVFPISIDYEEFADGANDVRVVSAFETIRKQAGGTQIVLSIDGLDYTKGIPERLTSFQTLLERHPDLRGKVTLIQAVVPGREQVLEYCDLKLQVETLVSRVNGEYGRTGWMPIQYFCRSLSRIELLALYRAAHVAFVTPLKDGMNLVAKEFCAARMDNLGVLVLSEFAGAAQELKCGALVVNPYHIARVASVLHFALLMDEAEQSERMSLMRSHIRRHDVFHWARSFLSESISPVCSGFKKLAPGHPGLFLQS